MIGTRLAHYEITHHLGSGGMGDLYRARDTKLDRDVAVKFLPNREGAVTEMRMHGVSGLRTAVRLK